MTIAQIASVALTVFDVVWLSVVLVLLIAIWRNSARYTRKLEQAQLEAAITAAKAAQASAEAAQILAGKHVEKETLAQ